MTDNKNRIPATHKKNQMHQAVDVFRNYLLVGFDDENRNLRQSTKILEALINVFTTVELRLSDSHVVSALLKQSTKIIGLDTYCISIDDSYPRHLMDFNAAEFRMMGQTVSTLSGPVRAQQGIDGKICLIFPAVSYQCAVAVNGYLDGLSDEDTASFIADKSYAERQILSYLQTGVGLQNSAAVTFTPTSFTIHEKSARFQHFMTLLNQRPSRESVKEELIMIMLVAKSSGDAGLICRRVENEFEHQFEEMVLNTLVAFGHTDEMMNLLVDNRMLKHENSVLCQVQEMIGMVEIYHPGFNIKALLNDGSLVNNEDGVLVWRIDITTNATPLSITINNITRLEVSVSGICMPRTVNDTSVGSCWNGIDIDWFSMTLGNGVTVDGSVYSTDSDSFLNSVGDVDVTVGLPLSFIQNTLVALGLHD